MIANDNGSCADHAESDGSTFGTALRAARLADQVSVRELARRVHYSHSYVSKVENGVKPPTWKFAQLCDEALECSGTLVAAAGRSVAAKSAWPRPVQLPPGPTQFVGREAELDRMGAALIESTDQPGAAPVVVLDGLPGVGKTALALHWAYQNLARFPDGLLFADLHGHSPDRPPVPPRDVLAEFCAALGMPGQLPAEEHQCAALLRSLLTDRRVLLVLDNALDTPQVRPLLPATPTCAVLVTSRRRLFGLSARDGARSVPVSPLDPPSAVTLVRKIVGERRANAEPEAVLALASQCAGLPLALRLVAQRGASRPDRSLTMFADGIPTAGSLLDELTADDDPRSAIRSVFSWSCRWLDWDAAQVFRSLGRHANAEFDEAMVTALIGGSTDKAAAAVRQLAATHLIEPTTVGRYRMHELIRMYARELAGDRRNNPTSAIKDR